MASRLMAQRRLLAVALAPLLLCAALLVAVLPVTASSAAVVRAPCSGNGNSGNSCYPPSKPRSSVSATHIHEGESVTYCVDGYHADADVALTEKSAPVDTIHTDGNGHGCVRLTPGPGCHRYSATGPDPSGEPATTGATVCVEATSTGQSTGGGRVSRSGDGGGGGVGGGGGGGTRSNEAGLPFTGAVLGPLLLVAAALAAAGTVAVRVGRRRRSS